MKKIILTAIGLAMFATPLAAGNPASSGVSQHQKHLHGLDPNTPTVQVPVGPPSRFVVSPAGSQSFGLTLSPNPAASNPARARSGDPYGRHGVPYSAPPQGWSFHR